MEFCQGITGNQSTLHKNKASYVKKPAGHPPKRKTPAGIFKSYSNQAYL